MLWELLNLPPHGRGHHAYFLPERAEYILLLWVQYIIVHAALPPSQLETGGASQYLCNISAVDGRVPTDIVIDLVLSRVHPDGTRTHHANRGSRPNGSFSFPDLKPGRWHIGASFTHGGQRLSGQLTVGVKPGQPPIQIRLRTQ